MLGNFNTVVVSILKSLEKAESDKAWKMGDMGSQEHPGDPTLNSSAQLKCKGHEQVAHMSKIISVFSPAPLPDHCVSFTGYAFTTELWTNSSSALAFVVAYLKMKEKRVLRY